MLYSSNKSPVKNLFLPLLVRGEVGRTRSVLLLFWLRHSFVKCVPEGKGRGIKYLAYLSVSTWWIALSFLVIWSHLIKKALIKKLHFLCSARWSTSFNNANIRARKEIPSRKYFRWSILFSLLTSGKLSVKTVQLAFQLSRCNKYYPHFYVMQC